MNNGCTCLDGLSIIHPDYLPLFYPPLCIHLQKEWIRPDSLNCHNSLAIYLIEELGQIMIGLLIIRENKCNHCSTLLQFFGNTGEP